MFTLLARYIISEMNLLIFCQKIVYMYKSNIDFFHETPAKTVTLLIYSILFFFSQFRHPAHIRPTAAHISPLTVEGLGL